MSDNVEKPRDGWKNMGEFGEKLAEDKNLKSIVMNGIEKGKVGKSENPKTDKERKDPDEVKLCK